MKEFKSDQEKNPSWDVPEETSIGQATVNFHTYSASIGRNFPGGWIADRRRMLVYRQSRQ